MNNVLFSLPSSVCDRRYLFIDFNSFLVLFQLSAVVSDLQKAFVGGAETTKDEQEYNGLIYSDINLILMMAAVSQ